MVGNKTVPAGRHTVKFDFKYDGGGPGKGGAGTLYIDGEKVGEGANVSSRYKIIHNRFTGKIHHVTIEKI